MYKKLLTAALLLPFTTVYAQTPSPAPGDTLKSALADILQRVTKGAGDAKEFLLSQLPDVIQQLLAWKFAESVASCLFAVAAIIGVNVLVRKFLAYGTKREWEDDGDTLAFGMFTTIVSIVGTAFFFCQINLVWLQIWLAPKVYLIEYARSLVK